MTPRAPLSGQHLLVDELEGVELVLAELDTQALRLQRSLNQLRGEVKQLREGQVSEAASTEQRCPRGVLLRLGEVLGRATDVHAAVQGVRKNLEAVTVCVVAAGPCSATSTAG